MPAGFRSRFRGLLLPLAALSLSGAASATEGPRSEVLVISGGGSVSKDKPRYINNVRDAVPALRNAIPGARLRLLAADGRGEAGKWSKLASEVKVPAQDLLPASKASIARAIRKAAKGLKAGDSLTLYVTDHGSNADEDADARREARRLALAELNSRPDAPKLSGEERKAALHKIYQRILPEQREKLRRADPLGAGIVLWGTVITGHELLKLLQKVSPGVRIRMMGVQCFSGMLNELANRLPNACAAASTDYRTVNLSSQVQSDYSSGFMAALAASKPGGASLASAHASGSRRDERNAGRAQLSSIHHAESVVIRSGGSDTEVFDRTAELASHPLVRRAMDLLRQRSGAGPASLVELLRVPTADKPGRGAPGSECTTQPESALSKIESFNGELCRILSAQARSPDGGMPPVLARYGYRESDWKAAIQQLRAAEPGLRAAFEDFLSERARVEQMWKEHEARGDGDLVPAEGTNTNRALLTERFERATRAFERAIWESRSMESYRLLSEGELLKRFDEVAKPDERSRFEALRRCETEPL